MVSKGKCFSFKSESYIIEPRRLALFVNLLEKGSGTVKEWYFEYQLHENRPGILGDISSLLGMLSINIVTINGVDDTRRGMLLRSTDDDNVKRFKAILHTIGSVTVTKFREPRVRDRLAIRHGRYIERNVTEKKDVSIYSS